MSALLAVYLGIGLISALISGVTGLAGGVLLLSALSAILPIEVVIPLHALIQVLANLSRVLILRKNIDWVIWRAFNLLTIPAGLLGAYSVSFLPREGLQVSVGAIVVFAALYTLRATLREARTLTAPEVQPSASALPEVTDQALPSRLPRRYVLLGMTSSLLGMVIGATGPLIAPFFMIDGLKRERFIATKSACQLTVQVIKTLIFAQLLRFAYGDHLDVIVMMVFGVITGTFIAKRVLRRVEGAWLELLIACLLALLGAKLLLKGLA